MRKTFLTVLGLFIVLTHFTSVSYGQLEFPDEKVKVTFSVERNGCDATITANVVIVPKWHINAVFIPPPTFLSASVLKINKNSNFVLVGKVKEPKPHFMHDELADEDLYYHEGTLKIKQKIKITGSEDFTIEGFFQFQTCNDVRCLPDYQYPISLKIKGCPKEEAIDAPVEGEIESSFVKNENGIASDKDGNNFVFVGSKWHGVPEGNSPEFFKKYIEIKGDEK